MNLSLNTGLTPRTPELAPLHIRADPLHIRTGGPRVPRRSSPVAPRVQPYEGVFVDGVGYLRGSTPCREPGNGALSPYGGSRVYGEVSASSVAPVAVSVLP